MLPDHVVDGAKVFALGEADNANRQARQTFGQGLDAGLCFPLWAFHDGADKGFIIIAHLAECHRMQRTTVRKRDGGRQMVDDLRHDQHPAMTEKPASAGQNLAEIPFRRVEMRRGIQLQPRFS